MFSNKENVNILTALIVSHGIHHAVVCPGSRNAPLTHNLNECEAITCHPITDERSAGFYALGMALRLKEPVAVCVTSGSALLNVLPAVAEAYYQQVPIVVISADRPPQWIDQNDGQTMPQGDALGRFVKKSVTLCEPADDEQRWMCNRLVNEVLLEATHHGCGPVHVNIPISEPLYEFTTEKLPEERKINRMVADDIPQQVTTVIQQIATAQKPMVLLSQYHTKVYDNQWQNSLEKLYRHCVVLAERLCEGNMPQTPIDDMVAEIEHNADYIPDTLVYIGGSPVSKKLKTWLRKANLKSMIRVSCDGTVADTFMQLDTLVEMEPERFVQMLGNTFAERAEKEKYNHTSHTEREAFIERWTLLRLNTTEKNDRHIGSSLQEYAVKEFEKLLANNASKPQVHYANSTAVRLAERHATHCIYCNRGINGIEGSLSAAAGMSMVTNETVYCVIGDLSFFYDQNALWAQGLRGNLRILLLNNGGGAIFKRFEGLKESNARERIVMACHHTTAEGICMENNVGYVGIRRAEQIAGGLEWLMNTESERPLLLEISEN